VAAYHQATLLLRQAIRPLAVILDLQLLKHRPELHTQHERATQSRIHAVHRHTLIPLMRVPTQIPQVQRPAHSQQAILGADALTKVPADTGPGSSVHIADQLDIGALAHCQALSGTAVQVRRYQDVQVDPGRAHCVRLADVDARIFQLDFVDVQTLPAARFR